MPSREHRAQDTQDAVLDAAIDRFFSEGFEKTSMDAIAAAANVAKGTLYYHYDSKEGILDAILERYARVMEQRLGAIEANDRDPMDKFALFVRAMKEVNSATFAKLHHIRYIDIHAKTAACIVERFAERVINPPLGHVHERRMPAADEQCHERRTHERVRELRGERRGKARGRAHDRGGTGTVRCSLGSGS